jgi:hypothetical protein
MVESMDKLLVLLSHKDININIEDNEGLKAIDIYNSMGYEHLINGYQNFIEQTSFVA